MADIENIPVEFKGEKYIWLRNEDGSGPLAYLEHIDDDGGVNIYNALFSDSFAHISSDGSIMRYGTKIGTTYDLELIEKDWI